MLCTIIVSGIAFVVASLLLVNICMLNYCSSTAIQYDYVDCNNISVSVKGQSSRGTIRL